MTSGEPCVLTVAGSDPSGGSGVQADVTTIAGNDAVAVSAVTAVTVQDTSGVSRIEALAPEIVIEQLRSVCNDIGVDAVKTGLLPTSPIVRAVAAELADRQPIAVVVDPVVTASSGDALADSDVALAIRDHLLPQAEVVVANLDEARMLTGLPVKDVAGMAKACELLLEMGPRWVLVTGGHLGDDDAIDLLVGPGGAHELVAARIPGVDPRGTGCALTAALACALARGIPVRDAASAAKDQVTDRIRRARRIGRGRPVLGPVTRAIGS